MWLDSSNFSNNKNFENSFIFYASERNVPLTLRGQKFRIEIQFERIRAILESVFELVKFFFEYFMQVGSNETKSSF